MKTICILIICAFLFQSVVFAGNKKCYALAIEGGGPKNAFTVGVLNAIWKYLPKEDRSYDVISGVSMGALNAYIMSRFPHGEERLAAEFLTALWDKMADSMVFQHWTWGYVQGLFFERGLYDTSPYLNTLAEIEKLLPKGFHRKLVVGMSDINSGFVTTVEETVGVERMHKYLQASAATPGFFPPVPDGNSTFADGSVLMSVDIVGAIDRCRESVENDEDIILDVIMVEEVKDLTKDCTKMNGIQMLFRYLEINGYLASMHNLENIITHYPSVQKRYIFYPDKSLPTSFIPVSFSHSDILAMMSQGEDEGKQTIYDTANAKSKWANVVQTMKRNLS